ncbi:MAG: MBOAT family protein [Planctomycetaceae bacterium]|nr:MBOAT family protein [Planctomycetaceae bacterium]
MLFHSWDFLVFFLVFYCVYLFVKGTRLKLPWLLVSSYVFYARSHPVYLVLICWATVFDYAAVRAMVKTRWKRPWLVLSIVNNLGLLGFFKYGRFLVDNVNALLERCDVPFAISDPNVSFLSTGLNAALSWLGTSYRVPPFDFMLPVGLSFYTFLSLGYVIDVYRGHVERERNLLRHATFISLFPQLLAGPIERAGHLLPQLRGVPKITRDDVADGLSLFVVGLFKKIALADYLALYVGMVYAAPRDYQAPALLLATFAYAWQIYFDFSGYTDMARGVARLMGIRLMLNFNNPYLATGLGDFWRRWHISLSTWFRDYVYIPLGGNRHGEVRTYINMILTMLISGLWHGAMWTYVMWGAVHAAGRVCTRALEQTTVYRERVPRFAKQMLTFSIVMVAWVFFRAASVSDAWLILGRIITSGLADPLFPLLLVGLVLSVWVYQYVYESRFRRIVSAGPVRAVLIVAMLIYMAAAVTSSNQEFIYLGF